MLYRLADNWSPWLRTLEIKQGEKGWYFTVHINTTFVFRSDEDKDRVAITVAGIQYLETLHKIDLEARKHKGKQSG